MSRQSIAGLENSDTIAPRARLEPMERVLFQRVLIARFEHDFMAGRENGFHPLRHARFRVEGRLPGDDDVHLAPSATERLFLARIVVMRRVSVFRECLPRQQRQFPRAYSLRVDVRYATQRDVRSSRV